MYLFSPLPSLFPLQSVDPRLSTVRENHFVYGTIDTGAFIAGAVIGRAIVIWGAFYAGTIVTTYEAFDAGAILAEGIVRGAIVGGAVVGGAIVWGAIVGGAIVRGAIVGGAIIVGAIVGGAIVV